MNCRTLWILCHKREKMQTKYRAKLRVLYWSPQISTPQEFVIKTKVIISWIIYPLARKGMVWEGETLFFEQKVTWHENLSQNEFVMLVQKEIIIWLCDNLQMMTQNFVIFKGRLFLKHTWHLRSCLLSMCRS